MTDEDNERMTEEDRKNWGYYIPFDLFEDDAIEHFARREVDSKAMGVKIWHHQSEDPDLKAVLPSEVGKNYGHDFGGIFAHETGEVGMRGNAWAGAYGKYLYEVQHSADLLAFDDVASLIYSSEYTDEVIKSEFGENLDDSEFDAIKDEISGSVRVGDLSAVSGKPTAFFPSELSIRTMPSSKRNEEHWTWKQAAASLATRATSDGG